MNSWSNPVHRFYDERQRIKTPNRYVDLKNTPAALRHHRGAAIDATHRWRWSHASAGSTRRGLSQNKGEGKGILIVEFSCSGRRWEGLAIVALLLKWILTAAVLPGGSPVSTSGKRGPTASCSAHRPFGRAREIAAQRDDGSSLELGWWWGKVDRGLSRWSFYGWRSPGGCRAMPCSWCRTEFGDRFWVCYESIDLLKIFFCFRAKVGNKLHVSSFGLRWSPGSIWNECGWSRRRAWWP
jgi:hypothetical protein